MIFSFQQILDFSVNQWYEAAQNPDSPFCASDIEKMWLVAKELANEGFLKKEQIEEIQKIKNPKDMLLALREAILKGAIAREEKKDPGNLKAILEENIQRMEDEAISQMQNRGASKEEARKIIEALNKYKLTSLQKADLLKKVASDPLEAVQTIIKHRDTYEAYKLVSALKYPSIDNTKAVVAITLENKNEIFVSAVTAFKLANPHAKPQDFIGFIESIQAKIEGESKEVVEYKKEGLKDLAEYKVATQEADLVRQTFTAQLLRSNPHLSYKEAAAISQELENDSVHHFAAQSQLQAGSDFSLRNPIPDRLGLNQEIYKIALEKFTDAHPNLKLSLENFNWRNIYQAQRLSFNNSQLVSPLRLSEPIRLFYGYIKRYEDTLNPYVKEVLSPLLQRMGLPPLSGTVTQQVYNRASQRIMARFVQSAIGKATIRTGTRFLIRTLGKEGAKKIIQVVGGSVTGGVLAVVIEVADWIGNFISKLPIIKDIISGTKKLFKQGVNGAALLAGIVGAAIAATLGGGVMAITGWGLASMSSASVVQGVFTNTGAAVGILQNVGRFVGQVSAMLVEVATVSIAMPIVITILATPIVVALLLFIINSSAYVLPKSLNYTIDASTIVPLGNGSKYPHCFPVRGVISQGPKGPSCSSHCSGEEFNTNALDIAASGIDRILPVPVRATHDGIISKTGYDSLAYGKFVILDSLPGVSPQFSTIYAHLDQILNLSRQVQAGTVIGFMGNTGHSTGKHLHYGLKSGTSILGSIPSFSLNANISEEDLKKCF